MHALIVLKMKEPRYCEDYTSYSRQQQAKMEQTYYEKYGTPDTVMFTWVLEQLTRLCVSLMAWMPARASCTHYKLWKGALSKAANHNSETQR